MTNRIREGKLALKLVTRCLVQLNWLFICTCLLCSLFPIAQAEYLNLTDHSSKEISNLESGKFRQLDFSGSQRWWDPVAKPPEVYPNELGAHARRGDLWELGRSLETRRSLLRLDGRVTLGECRGVGEPTCERRSVRDVSSSRDQNNFGVSRESRQNVLAATRRSAISGVTSRQRNQELGRTDVRRNPNHGARVTDSDRRTNRATESGIESRREDHGIWSNRIVSHRRLLSQASNYRVTRTDDRIRDEFRQTDSRNRVHRKLHQSRSLSYSPDVRVTRVDGESPKGDRREGASNDRIHRSSLENRLEVRSRLSHFRTTRSVERDRNENREDMNRKFRTESVFENRQTPTRSSLLRDARTDDRRFENIRDEISRARTDRHALENRQGDRSRSLDFRATRSVERERDANQRATRLRSRTERVFENRQIPVRSSLLQNTRTDDRRIENTRDEISRARIDRVAFANRQGDRSRSSYFRTTRSVDRDRDENREDINRRSRTDRVLGNRQIPTKPSVRNTRIDDRRNENIRDKISRARIDRVALENRQVARGRSSDFQITRSVERDRDANRRDMNPQFRTERVFETRQMPVRPSAPQNTRTDGRRVENNREEISRGRINRVALENRKLARSHSSDFQKTRSVKQNRDENRRDMSFRFRTERVFKNQQAPVRSSSLRNTRIDERRDENIRDEISRARIDRFSFEKRQLIRSRSADFQETRSDERDLVENRREVNRSIQDGGSALETNKAVRSRSADIDMTRKNVRRIARRERSLPARSYSRVGEKQDNPKLYLNGLDGRLSLEEATRRQISMSRDFRRMLRHDSSSRHRFGGQLREKRDLEDRVIQARQDWVPRDQAAHERARGLSERRDLRMRSETIERLASERKYRKPRMSASRASSINLAGKSSSTRWNEPSGRFFRTRSIEPLDRTFRLRKSESLRSDPSLESPLRHTRNSKKQREVIMNTEANDYEESSHGHLQKRNIELNYRMSRDLQVRSTPGNPARQVTHASESRNFASQRREFIRESLSQRREGETRKRTATRIGQLFMLPSKVGSGSIRNIRSDVRFTRLLNHRLHNKGDVIDHQEVIFKNLRADKVSRRSTETSGLRNLRQTLASLIRESDGTKTIPEEARREMSISDGLILLKKTGAPRRFTRSVTYGVAEHFYRSEANLGNSSPYDVSQRALLRHKDSNGVRQNVKSLSDRKIYLRNPAERERADLHSTRGNAYRVRFERHAQHSVVNNSERSAEAASLKPRESDRARSYDSRVGLRRHQFRGDLSLPERGGFMTDLSEEKLARKPIDGRYLEGAKYAPQVSRFAELIGVAVSRGLLLVASPVKMLMTSLTSWATAHSGLLMSCLSWASSLALVLATVLDQKTLANSRSTFLTYFNDGVMAVMIKLGSMLRGCATNFTESASVLLRA